MSKRPPEIAEILPEPPTTIKRIKRLETMVGILLDKIEHMQNTSATTVGPASDVPTSSSAITQAGASSSTNIPAAATSAEVIDLVTQDDEEAAKKKQEEKG